MDDTQALITRAQTIRRMLASRERELVAERIESRRAPTDTFRQAYSHSMAGKPSAPDTYRQAIVKLLRASADLAHATSPLAQAKTDAAERAAYRCLRRAVKEGEMLL